MLDLLWNDHQLLAAAAIAEAGLFVLWRGWRILRQRPLHADDNVRRVRAMRAGLLGGSLLVAALGWALHLPVLVALGAIVGFEETLETSIMTWALKQEQQGKVQAPTGNR